MVSRVVVGVDGSPAAAAALAWAAGEAGLRGAELVACTVLGRPAARHGADAAAPPGRRSIEESTGGYPVTVRRRYGDAGSELVTACTDADLLVLGAPRRGGLAGLAVGPVTRYCLAHAPCPVVAARPRPERTPSGPTVIVGIDGSDHSRQALRVAAGEARLRHAALDVVHAVWWDSIGTELSAPTTSQLVGWGRELVAAELTATGVEGTPAVVGGHAAEVLVRRSKDADLLVLGSRGHNVVAGVLLGSTSEHCLQHAHCPVMITHASEGRQFDRLIQPVDREVP